MAKNPTIEETARKEIEQLSKELNSQKDRSKELKKKIRTRMQIIKKLEKEKGDSDGKEAQQEPIMPKVPNSDAKEGTNQGKRKKI